jgi:O-antigen/teichoic acid export membrane protein
MSLRAQAFAAVRWTSLAMIGRAGVQFVQVLILARLLSPGDFGLMAMVASVIAIATVLTDLGVSNAIIHHQAISEAERSALYWLNLAAGAALTAATALGAPALAAFFGEPRLIPLLRIASLIFVLAAAGQQLRVMAQKGLRFGRLALIEIGAALIGAVTAVSLAAGGAGVQSIAIGSVAAAAASSLAAWPLLSGGWRPALPIDLRPARRFISYGADTIGVGLLGALNMQSDVIVGGRFLPHAQLGFYSLPRDLCLRLMLIMNPIITRVGLPVIARAQSEEARVRAVFRQTMRMSASINFPIYAALSLFAPEIVRILFGPAWEAAAPIMRIAAIAALFRSIGNPLGSLLYALGRTRTALWISIAVMAAIFPALIAGAQFGLYGLACANLVFFAAQVVPLWRFAVKPSCGLGFTDYHKQLAIPAATTLFACAAAAAAAAPISPAWPRLIIGCGVGAGAYLTASYALNRAWLVSILELAAPRRFWPRALARSV